MTKINKKSDNFYIVTESHTNIMKITHLISVLNSTLQLALIKYQDYADYEISDTLLYEYLSDKQYKDIIEKLQELPATTPIAVDKDFLKNVTLEGKKISTTIAVPVINVKIFDNDIPKSILMEITEIYDNYQMITNLILPEIIESGSKLSKQHMKKMNRIYRHVKSLRLLKEKVPTNEAIDMILQFNKNKKKSNKKS